MIELGKCYHCRIQKTLGSVNLETLAKLVQPLEKFNAIIGMTELKDGIVEQIIYSLSCGDTGELNHTEIYGDPGVGKSMVLELVAEIYVKMGVLTKNVIKKVKSNRHQR